MADTEPLKRSQSALIMIACPKRSSGTNLSTGLAQTQNWVSNSTACCNTYLTFPRVEVALKGRKADSQRDADRRSGVRQLGPLGRNDMRHFFDWLYKKGVRHIIRVIVDDSGDLGATVHTDDAIQESIEKFVVEHLDWKKSDLDPETILHVSSKVEKAVSSPQNPGKEELVLDRQLSDLYLRWSGSNAVLRGWSEPEGLAMLPRLKKIYLTLSDKVRTLIMQTALFHRVYSLFSSCFSQTALLMETRHTTASRGSTPKLKPLVTASTQIDGLFGCRLKSNCSLRLRSLMSFVPVTPRGVW